MLAQILKQKICGGINFKTSKYFAKNSANGIRSETKLWTSTKDKQIKPRNTKNNV